MKLYISSCVSWTDLGDYVFIFNESRDMMYSMYGILRDLWLHITQYNTFEEVLYLMSEQYSVDFETLKKDMHQAIGQLEAEGLIERK